MAFCVTTNETFQVETCCNCGVRFAMTNEFYTKRIENRGHNNPFYCPNGHKQWYIGKSEADKLRDENLALQRKIEIRDAAVQRERNSRERVELRLRATKGVVTRIRKRVSHGVCPCCTRSFTDLRRHMENKHPTFTAEAAE